MSLNATLLNDIQASGAINEKRFSEKGIINAVKASTPFVTFLTPSVKAQMQTISSDRDVQFPQLQDQTVITSSSPSFTIPANLTTSAQVSFTAVDVFSGFRHYPSLYANNVIDGEWDKQQKFLNIADAMATDIEVLLETRLAAKRSNIMNFVTQISQGDGVYTFNTTPDTLEINKAAQQETMFSNLTSLMEANDLPGNYRVVTSRAGLAVQKTEALKFGAGNEKNLQALGMFGVDQMHQSNSISAGSDVFNGYLLRDGSIGMIENFPADFVAGTKLGAKEWSISDMEIPGTGMRANIFTNSEATDATALVTSGTDSNLKMTHFEEMAIWQRFFIVDEYNSDLTTRVSSIVQLSGKTS